jgi:hypothetical protein
LFGRQPPKYADDVPEPLGKALAAINLRSDSRLTLTIKGAPPMWRFNVPGDRAIDIWERLSKDVEATGYWPVLLGANDDVARLLEIANADETPVEEIIEASRSESVDQLMDWWRHEATPVEGEEVDIVGEWPERAESNSRFTVPYDIRTGKPRITSVAVIPTKESWQVPAYLRWGEWNACPAARQHLAVHRRWTERYGSDIVAITSDIIECRVRRPPSSREDAMTLAQEQFAYCSDIVYQGAGTIAGLAGTLVNAPVWYFWWD